MFVAIWCIMTCQDGFVLMWRAFWWRCFSSATASSHSCSPRDRPGRIVASMKEAVSVVDEREVVIDLLVRRAIGTPMSAIR